MRLSSASAGVPNIRGEIFGDKRNGNLVVGISQLRSTTSDERSQSFQISGEMNRRCEAEEAAPWA